MTGHKEWLALMNWINSWFYEVPYLSEQEYDHIIAMHIIATESLTKVAA